MKTAQVKITGISPLSQGKYYASSVPKLEKESAKDYEERTSLPMIWFISAYVISSPG